MPTVKGENVAEGASPLSFKEKLFRVTQDIGLLVNDGRNDFQHYSYPTDANITERMKALFTQYRLLFSATCAGIDVTGGLTQAKMVYRIDDLDSDNFKEANFFGHGADKGDKGVYKAYTGAKKYFFNQNFLIASSDDAEKPEEESRSAPKAKREMKPQPKQAPKAVAVGGYDQSTPPKLSNPWLWVIEGTDSPVTNAIKGKRLCENATGTVRKILNAEWGAVFSNNDRYFAEKALENPKLRESAVEDAAEQARPAGYVDFSEDQVRQ